MARSDDMSLRAQGDGEAHEILMVVGDHGALDVVYHVTTGDVVRTHVVETFAPVSTVTASWVSEDVRLVLGAPVVASIGAALSTPTVNGGAHKDGDVMYATESPLPPGVELTREGALTGVPTAVGEFPVRVIAYLPEDFHGVGQAVLTLRVVDGDA